MTYPLAGVYSTSHDTNTPQPPPLRGGGSGGDCRKVHGILRYFKTGLTFKLETCLENHNF